MAAVETLSRYRWVILGLAFLAQWTAAMAGKVLAPLAPIFQPELGLTKAEVGLFSSATFAGAWVVLLVAGSLTDRFGIRVMMVLGQIATGALLLTMSAVGSVYQAAAVMFAAGVGRGTVFPGASKAVLEWFPPSTRATAMGIKQTGAPVAGIVTAVTLPALGLAFGWRAAIAAVGFAIIAGGLIAAALYRNSPYAATQATKAKPTIREGMRGAIRNRNLWILGSIAVLFVMAQQALVLYLALYFSEVVLVPQIPDETSRIVAAGGFLAVLQVGGVVGRIGWGAISDRIFAGRRVLVMGVIGVLAGTLSLSVAQMPSGYPLWLITILVFLIGTTAVGWNGVYHTLVTESAGHKYAATGVGLSMTMIESGTTLGPPLFGFVLDMTSYATGWLFLTLFFGVGAAIAFLFARSGGGRPV